MNDVLAAPAASDAGAGAGWRAELALGFSTDASGATRLSFRKHRGPLVVQRPFHPEGPAVPHVYVLHPPGGLVGGDRVRLQVDVARGGHALLTTPAATKVYRTAGPLATLTQELAVGPDAALEWLPQENILHDGAHAELVTQVALAEGARFVGVDTVCFGLPARGETFATGRCAQRFEVRRGNRPILIERGRFDARDPLHGAPWGLDGARVHGLMVVAPAPAGAALLAEARAAAAAVERGRAGVTVLHGGDVLVGRYLGPSAEHARLFFQSLWVIVRPAVLGRAAVAPRIWAT
ncbi:MAG: urease accessory protein UreD [Pseudomonadota bacterium]